MTPGARPLLSVGALLAVLAGAGCGAPPQDSAQRTLAERLMSAEFIDLTHPFSEETLVWPTSIPFAFETVFDGETDAGYHYAARNFAGPEHGGTHLDAPIHFAAGRWTTEAIPLERLIAPGVVVDVAAPARAKPTYEVAIEDFTSWETEHGQIPEGAIVLLSTDRSRLWGDARAYMGTDGRDEDAVADLRFPGLHPDAARWLVEERAIGAVGIDTPSMDHGPSTLFEAHRILADANVPIFENVANLERLPATGAVIVALPMKLEGGTGGPLRIVAILDR